MSAGSKKYKGLQRGKGLWGVSLYPICKVCLISVPYCIPFGT